jgi:hypothetical protein
MKKLIAFMLICTLAFSAGAQISKTFTPASNDSVVGAVTKYCTLSAPITFQYSAAIEIYLTSSVGANDSTWVTIEGSMNNSTWYVVNMGTPVLSGSASLAGGSVSHYTIGAASGGLLFQPTWYISPLYLRIKLQHYVAATSAKITRASIYLKKD